LGLIWIGEWESEWLGREEYQLIFVECWLFSFFFSFNYISWYFWFRKITNCL